MKRALFLLPLLVACQEYEISSNAEVAGTYNPPPPPDTKQVDEITQVTIPAVDVLWIIDDSCSMQEEQTALRSNFGEFMRYFTGSGMDYHVGVVSTDMDDRNKSGKLIEDGGTRYIDDSLSEDAAISSFRNRANLGTNGSGIERGKDAAFAAIATYGNSVNSGFYREDASLSMIVISDETDQSNTSVTEFVNWMQDLKAGTDNVATFSSVVGLTNNDCNTAVRGSGYLEVTSQVGGISWSICDSNWADLLTELGLQAAGLKREFFLSLAPVEETITVDVVGDDEFRPGQDTWTYNPSRNSITFDSYIPAPLAVVTVEYTPLATALEESGEEVTE